MKIKDKVLIVEDEILARLGLRQLVDWRKLELELLPDATDGEEALEMIRNSRPDIILLDLNIPRVSGLEILEFQTVAVIGLAAVCQPQCCRGRFSGSIGIPPQGRIFLCTENPHRTYGTYRKQHENTQNPCHCTLSHHISLSFSFSLAMKVVTEQQSTKNPASLMLCQYTIISSFKSSRGGKNRNFCLTVRNFRPLACAVYSLLKQILQKYFHPDFSQLRLLGRMLPASAGFHTAGSIFGPDFIL